LKSFIQLQSIETYVHVPLIITGDRIENKSKVKEKKHEIEINSYRIIISII